MAPRKDHARLGTLNFLTEEARRIAANIVKLPDLIRRYTAFANSKLGNSDGEARKRSPFPVHPHMLRHSTAYKLANDGALAHYLGHRNLQSTARYTALAPDRFKAFWRD